MQDRHPLIRETVQTRFNLAAPQRDDPLSGHPTFIMTSSRKSAELTGEASLVTNSSPLKKAIQRLQKGGIPVSLFVDPHRAQIKASREAGARTIEIHTGHYCDAKTPAQADEEFKRLLDAVGEASGLDLEIAAGHGLNYVNVSRVAEIKEIVEFNIGHSIIARAVLVGLDRAVREMLALVRALEIPSFEVLSVFAPELLTELERE
jgi:pyridoxine 5-phosphate synthase